MPRKRHLIRMHASQSACSPAHQNATAKPRRPHNAGVGPCILLVRSKSLLAHHRARGWPGGRASLGAGPTRPGAPCGLQVERPHAVAPGARGCLLKRTRRCTIRAKSMPTFSAPCPRSPRSVAAPHHTLGCRARCCLLRQLAGRTTRPSTYKLRLVIFHSDISPQHAGALPVCRSGSALRVHSTFICAAAACLLFIVDGCLVGLPLSISFTPRFACACVCLCVFTCLPQQHVYCRWLALVRVYFFFRPALCVCVRVCLCVYEFAAAPCLLSMVGSGTCLFIFAPRVACVCVCLCVFTCLPQPHVCR